MSNFSIKSKPFDKNSKDTVRIKGDRMFFKVNAVSGKQGEFIVFYCPSLRISGYGKTRDEAENMLKHEIQVFCEDVIGMPHKEREAFLLSMGFSHEIYNRKNYSKTYVDEEGKLQDFEPGTIEHQVLATAS